jgi:hypothetical protein
MCVIWETCIISSYSNKTTKETEPLEYISRMIKCDFYGVVAKKTTTSSDFIQNMFDKLKEIE